MPTQRLSALRHPDFRTYWIGYVVSVSGQQMLWMLEPWLIYELSGSKAALGVNALAQAIPATALVLLGGVIADRLDQRKLLIAVQAAYILLLGILAALALAEVLVVWHIFVIAFLHSAVGSFENPARQSMFPHLVPRSAMPNAVALNATIHPATRIGAPVLGGFILAIVLEATGSARIAAGTVLLVTIAGVAVYALTLTRIQLPRIGRSSTSGIVGGMAEGASFIWRNRIFGFLIGLAYYNMFFGTALTILFPVIAKDILNVGPDVLGVMWGAMGIGSVAGVIIAARSAAPRHQRTLLAGAPVLLGVSMISFALTPIYLVSLLILFLIGTGASAFNVAIQQNLQMLVPNDFRGRVMGVWSMVHSSIRPMGEMQFSAIAALATTPFSLIFSGGMLVGAAVLFSSHRHMRRLPDLREAALVEGAEIPR